MYRFGSKHYFSICFLWFFFLAGGCFNEFEEDCADTADSEKVGILFLQVGTDEIYSFNWVPQFMRNLYDFFPAGQMVGGPEEGGDCYTIIHYADEIEAQACSVAPGTPIDVFCNVYKNSDDFPVHSILDVGIPAYIRQCAGQPANFWTRFMFSGMHATVDPASGAAIAGPVVSDPAGSGIGIEDFLEVAGFDWMRTIHNLPGKKDIHRKQLLKWWYGNDAPQYSPDSRELVNIKDRLQQVMPDATFVFRHAWEAYLVNQDAYGNPTLISDSAQTAIDELINDEKVGKIIVVHTYPSFSNLTQYGHDWVDQNNEGVSAVPGKTFKECVEDINDGYGPDTAAGLSNYLRNKPFESHQEHPFPLIQRLVDDQNHCIPLTFAPAYGEFEDFDKAVVALLRYTVEKYDIPATASLKVILGHHGYYGGYEKAQECDSYFKEADALYERVGAFVKNDFSWPGKFQIAHGAIEYAEGGMGDDDPPTAEKPAGEVMGVAEEIDRGINGRYVNSQGTLVDNGTDNFDYIIFIPYFFDSESADTLYGAREVLGNMIPPDPNGRDTGYYLRDTRDADGTEFDAGDVDDLNFTVKVYDASGWASTPVGDSRSYTKGSETAPTTVIVTGTILSLGNGDARERLTEAAVKAITSSM